jgi:hypothetical protein
VFAPVDSSCRPASVSQPLSERSDFSTFARQVSMSDLYLGSTAPCVRQRQGDANQGDQIEESDTKHGGL